MKSENGVTLVALITIIIVLIIIMSIGIYSGINAYKVMDFEKYKAQMQLIQNAVDELYEENKNNEMQGESKYYYGDKVYDKDKGSYESVVKKFCTNVLEKEFELTDLTREEYYYMSAEEVEDVFNLEDIDISEYFIINYEKRYVFSVTPGQVITGKNEDGTDIYENVYCLYQLDGEKKVIDFKVDDNFEYDNFEYIIYKKENKQILEISNNINIEKVEVDANKDGNFNDDENVKQRKDYCSKIVGLDTKKVTLEIVKNCKIKVTDIFKNYKEIEIQLYDVPVLKENMIPIRVINKDEGIISYINDPEWYDYYTKTILGEDGKTLVEVIDEEKTNFAVAINANTTYPSDEKNAWDTTYNNYYKVNVSDTVSTILTVPESIGNQPVKVWLPKNLNKSIKNTYKTPYDESDFTGTGMWVDAWWNGTKYIPCNKWFIFTIKRISYSTYKSVNINYDLPIKKLEIEIENENGEYVKVTGADTEEYYEILQGGLETTSISLKIKKTCRIRVTDEFGNYYIEEVLI